MVEDLWNIRMAKAVYKSKKKQGWQHPVIYLVAHTLNKAKGKIRHQSFRRVRKEE